MLSTLCVAERRKSTLSYGTRVAEAMARVEVHQAAAQRPTCPVLSGGVVCFALPGAAVDGSAVWIGRPRARGVGLPGRFLSSKRRGFPEPMVTRSIEAQKTKGDLKE